MATIDNLRGYAQNPNVRRFLDTIAQAEGTTGYDTAFGGGKIESLADHPRTLHDFTQTDGKRNKTSAAGRYQFLRGTWDDVAGTLGLTDFGPESQDLAAIELLRRNGSLEPLLAGDFDTAVRRSGTTWASLPSSPYPQPKRSEGFITNALNRAADAVFPAAHAGVNPFDQFDAPASEANLTPQFEGSALDSGANPFDQFDSGGAPDLGMPLNQLNVHQPEQTQIEPQDRSHREELARQFGLTGRYALEGVTALPNMLWNGPAGVVNWLAGDNVIPRADASATADAIGLPSPETARERVVGDVATLMAGTSPLGAVDRLAKGVTGTTKAVMSGVSSNLGSQVASAAGAGAVGGGAREMGFGPAVQTGAALVGGGLAGAAVNRATTPARTKGTTDATRDLQRRAGNLYEQANSRGISAPPELTTKLRADISNLVADEGLITPLGNLAEGYPKINGVMRMIDEYAGQPMTAKQMQSVRRLLSNAAQSADKAESRIGTLMIRSFDDFTAPLAPELAEARSLYTSAMRAQQLEGLRDVAESNAKRYSQSGAENALRAEYRSLYNRILRGKERGWTPEQVEAIRRVAEGTPASNAARYFGKLAPTGVVSAGLGGGVPFMVGNAIGGPPIGGAASLGTMGLGAVSRNAATTLTSRNAALAEALARNMPLSSAAMPTLTTPLAAMYAAALMSQK